MAAPNDDITQGLALQQAGQWPDALACYRRLVARSPADARGHFLLGVAEAHCGHLPQAIQALQKSLGLKPDFVEAAQALGGAYLVQGKYRDAAAALENARRLAPAIATVHYELGAAYLGLKQPTQAIASYQAAIRLKPDYADAYNNLGNVLKNAGRMEEAEAAYEGAITASADHAQAWYNLGIVRQLRDKPAGAIEAYQRALILVPGNFSAENNLGLVLRNEHRLDEAIAAFQRAIALNPTYEKALNNLGTALQDRNRLAEAIAVLESAVALSPNDANALCSLGNVLVASNRAAESIPLYEKAHRLKPKLQEVTYNIALAQLVLGDLEHGWAGYDSRTESPRFVERYRFQKPRWTGKESLEGKTILLFAEQGLGDTLQFIRYVPRVAKLAARVIVRIQPALKPLLGQPDGILYLAPEDGTPSFDYQCPLLSLPYVFGTRLESSPAEIPYVRAPEAKLAAWRAVFAKAPGLKIGIVWSGNPKHQFDYNRSLPIGQFAKILEGVPAHFFAIQKDIRIDDARALLMLPTVTDLSRQITDFSDTAAIVSALDLVIAVDTSVAHLAGALGTKTWTLISYAPDWRWLLERTDSPWYPSMRLVRQTEAGNWDPAVTALNRELMALATAANAGLV